jgi:anaerobic magnesium-protoporphyrin IX monomethyl ester cyclase
MRILVIWPPQVPSYFNAGHHLTIFNVASHLRATFPSVRVQAIDAAALNITWKSLGDLLVDQPDIVMIANDFDSTSSFQRSIFYARTLAKDVQIVTFGRLSARLPEFFQQFDLDAIVAAGDPEAALEDVVRTRAENGPPPETVWRRVGGSWAPPTRAPRILTSEELPLPDVSEIPYEAYDRLYADDTARFCGIPKRRELVVPVGRGCPVNCVFCEIPGREGTADRRPSIPRLISYISAMIREHPFEYVSMYAPTFTLRNRWVHEFCDAYLAAGIGVRWKCTTTLHHLDDGLIRRMGEAGCVRISVGLETLEPTGNSVLPRIKQVGLEKFTHVAEACATAGIELNCFVILGLPGTSLAGVRDTMEAVHEVGGRVRPTIYTDFDLMRPDMDESAIASFNRQLFLPGHEPPEAQDYYRILFNPRAPVTMVHEAIPQRSAG